MNYCSDSFRLVPSFLASRNHNVNGRYRPPYSRVYPPGPMLGVTVVPNIKQSRSDIYRC